MRLETARDAAVVALERGHAREGGADAQELRVARVDAGHDRVHQRLRHLRADPPPRERIDRLVGDVRAAAGGKLLGEQMRTWRRQLNKSLRRKGNKPAGKLAQPAVEEEEAVPRRHVAGRQQAVGSGYSSSRHSSRTAGLLSRKPFGPASTR